MIQNFKLSPHLDFFEMTDSEDHPELVELNRGIAFESERIMTNLRCWAKFIFEPVRKLLGSEPIEMGSGYRCFKLNSVTLGASKTSQHMYGEAGDPFLSKKKQLQLLEILILEPRIRRKLMVDKWVVIPQNSAPFQFHELRFYPDRGFVHIGLPRLIRDMEITWGCK